MDKTSEGASREAVALANAALVAATRVPARPCRHRPTAKEGPARVRANQVLKVDVDARAIRRATFLVELLVVATWATGVVLNVVAAIVEGRSSAAVEVP